jgi:hypothetical protein
VESTLTLWRFSSILAVRAWSVMLGILSYSMGLCRNE